MSHTLQFYFTVLMHFYKDKIETLSHISIYCNDFLLSVIPCFFLEDN